MLTYTGIHITKEFGVPSIRDIAVQAMRIPRFCGAGEKFWPLGAHLLFVEDLVRTREMPSIFTPAYALLHDAPEIVVNDTPKPMKTTKASRLEHRLLLRMLANFGLPAGAPAEHEAVKVADIRAVNVEGRMIGVRGFSTTQHGIDWQDGEALKLFNRYFEDSQLTLEYCWNPEGHLVNLLERRLRAAIEVPRGAELYRDCAA